VGFTSLAVLSVGAPQRGLKAQSKQPNYRGQVHGAGFVRCHKMEQVSYRHALSGVEAHPKDWQRLTEDGKTSRDGVFNGSHKEVSLFFRQPL
jgi:hypothetical protein